MMKDDEGKVYPIPRFRIITAPRGSPWIRRFLAEPGFSSIILAYGQILDIPSPVQRKPPQKNGPNDVEIPGSSTMVSLNGGV